MIPHQAVLEALEHVTGIGGWQLDLVGGARRSGRSVLRDSRMFIFSRFDVILSQAEHQGLGTRTSDISYHVKINLQARA